MLNKEHCCSHVLQFFCPHSLFHDKWQENKDGHTDDMVRTCYKVTDNEFLRDCRPVAEKIIRDKVNSVRHKHVGSFREKYFDCEFAQLMRKKCDMRV